MEEATAPRRLPPLGASLRELLDADPKALRRAMERRAWGGGDARASSSSSRAIASATLAASLDALVAFLTDPSRSSADGAIVDPVVDPLLERVVPPPRASDASGPERGSSRATRKRAALRLVAWLLAPAPSGAGAACGDAVATTLAARCSPATPRRERLAACVAVRHAAVVLPPGATLPRALAADGPAARSLVAALDLAETERRDAAASGAPAASVSPEDSATVEPARDLHHPPTRLAVAALDAALALTARDASVAADDGDSEERERRDAASRALSAPRGRARSRRRARVARAWWRPSSRAPIAALDAVAAKLDDVERWAAAAETAEAAEAGRGRRRRATGRRRGRGMGAQPRRPRRAPAAPRRRTSRRASRGLGATGRR